MTKDHYFLTADRLQAAARRLARAEREVLELRTRDGLPVRGIAARLGISPRKAERLLARAVRKVVAELDRRERRERLRRRLRSWLPW